MSDNREYTDEQRKKDTERLQQAVTPLMEHFDTVHIFATRHEAGTLDGTLRCSTGRGNWFARMGQIFEWVQYQIGVSRARGEQEFMEDNTI